MKKLLIILLVITISHTHLKAQKAYSQADENLISDNFDNTPVNEALDHLEENYNLRFFYKPEWVSNKKIGLLNLSGASLDFALQKILSNTSLSYSIIDDNYIILFPGDPSISKQSEKVAEPILLTGKVTSANLLTALPNVTIFVEDQGLGTVSDLDGNYSILISPGRHTLIFRSIEVLEEKYDFHISKENSTLDIELFERNRQLEEVVVTASELTENLTSVDVGKVQFSKDFYNKLPTFLGEIDISRVVKSLPGVQSVGEGTADFNVRGGNRDQNLILMDGMPIYNSSHLLGFFSVFNPDLVRNFTLYKGSIPARYGGRLSSVLNVELKNPTLSYFSLDGGVGFVTNRLALNIPISAKHAFSVAGRYSNPTWILKRVKDRNIKQSSAQYYDFNLKYRYMPSTNGVLTVSSFFSNDDFYFAGYGTGFDYTNIGVSANYVHNFSSKLSSQLRGSYTNYSASALEDIDTNIADIFTSGITNAVLFFDLAYQVNENILLTSGYEGTLSNYNLGQTIPANTKSIVNPSNIPGERSLENALFVMSELRLSGKLKVGAGLRYSIFSNLGPINEYVFDPTRPKSKTSVIDTIVTSSNEIIRSFSGFEPRISGTYSIKEDLSIKVSYSRTRQYQYLFSNSAASLPVDVWKPADNNIPVQLADQISIGMVSKIKHDTYDFSADVFYKTIPSTAILKIGVPAIKNELLVADVVNANAKAYGTEFLLRKVKGNLSGFISYTYAVSKIKVQSVFDSESVNNGDYFRSDFDSPHNLSISATMKINKLLSFSANFIFISGRPVTLPTASYVTDNVRVFSISERNNFRIPNTHRLDLAITLEGSYKKNRKWRSSWVLSVYNVYGRENPFSVYLRAENNTQPRLIQLSVLGSVFPSLTYNFKFSNQSSNL